MMRAALLLAPVMLSHAGIAVSQTEGALHPRVAEPMVFDLMRPLGAPAGELEANVLALPPLSAAATPLEWAPEIEYAVADGLAVELELPFEDGRLTDVKAGIQYTLPAPDARTAHGIQYFTAKDLRGGGFGHTLVYIVAHRFDPRWSMVAMAGLGDVRFGRQGATGPVLNHTTFYDVREGMVAGLEINFKGGRGGGVLLMPQLHRELTPHVNLQAGAGLDIPRGQAAAPVAGLRLVREF